MTRPARNSLVLDGETIKMRLLAERSQSKAAVHVDWLRFTVQRRLSPISSEDVLFPREPVSVWDADFRKRQFDAILKGLPGGEFDAAAQAMELAKAVAEALGSEFSVCPEMRNGYDFYKHRWSIERFGSECGWVGFLSSSDSKRQQAQSKTIHVNLYGLACTFAEWGWMERMASIIEDRDADITRADLALDFFDGLPGGIDGVRTDYMAGLLDVYGKRPKCNMVGDWCNATERSFYVGSKAAGKQTNIYEKGHQLFGAESANPWARVELRYGNKLRVLPVDLLRRPSDFFAGASPWHARMLSLADKVFAPEPIATKPKLAIQTVQAEVTRNLRWLRDTAAATVRTACSYLDVEVFADLAGAARLPGRLKSFSPAELQRAFTAAAASFLHPTADPGQVMQAS